MNFEFPSDFTRSQNVYGVPAGAVKLTSTKSTGETSAVLVFATPLASPTDFVDVSFDAPAGTPYTFWLRVKSLGNSKYNDSLYVQFSDALASGSPIYPMNSTSGLVVNLSTDSSGSSNNGWGWVNGAYWLNQPATLTFASSGTHTIRIQVREDGVQFDQIVLSPSQYLSASASCPTACTGAPGPVNNDSTIVPKPTPPGPPGAPGSPNPGDTATGVSTSPSLTWTAAGATSYSVYFGTTNPPPLVIGSTNQPTYAPTALSNSTVYYWKIVAIDAGGTTDGPIWSFTTIAATSPTDVVIYAGDLTGANVHGSSWAFNGDPASPGSTTLVTLDNGISNTAGPLASPAQYVDVPFTATAGVPYTLWIRVKATGNSKLNDSFFVQFSDALAGGAPIYQMNTTQGLVVNLATDSTASSLNGWGWVNGAYWLNQPATMTFASTGTHTLRIQIREDGFQFDQIVLSPSHYLNPSASCPTSCGGAPGPATNDSTIVPKP